MVLLQAVGFDWFANQFSQGATYILGNNAYIGFFVLLFFGGFLVFQGNGPKLVIMIFAGILASLFIPWLAVIIGLVGAFVLYLALMRFTQR